MGYGAFSALFSRSVSDARPNVPLLADEPAGTPKNVWRIILRRAYGGCLIWLERGESVPEGNAMPAVDGYVYICSVISSHRMPNRSTNDTKELL